MVKRGGEKNTFGQLGLPYGQVLPVRILTSSIRLQRFETAWASRSCSGKTHTEYFEKQHIKRGSGLRSLNFIIAATTELSWTKCTRNFKSRSLQVAVRHFFPRFVFFFLSFPPPPPPPPPYLAGNAPIG